MKRFLLALVAAVSMSAGLVAVSEVSPVHADGPFFSSFTYCGDYSHGYRRVCIDPTTNFGHAMLYVYNDPAHATTYTASSPVTFAYTGIQPGWVTTPSYGGVYLAGSGAYQGVFASGIVTGPAVNTVCLAQALNPPVQLCSYEAQVYTDGYSSYHGSPGASLAQVWSEVVATINAGGNFQVAN